MTVNDASKINKATRSNRSRLKSGVSEAIELSYRLIIVGMGGVEDRSRDQRDYHVPISLTMTRSSLISIQTFSQSYFYENLHLNAPPFRAGMKHARCCRQHQSGRVAAWRSSGPASVCDTRYHLVWTPKYRKWVLQGAIQHRVKALFQEIARHHGCDD